MRKDVASLLFVVSGFQAYAGSLMVEERLAPNVVELFREAEMKALLKKDVNMEGPSAVGRGFQICSVHFSFTV